jgi:hypothetical protein
LFCTEQTSNSLLAAAHFAHSSGLSLKQDFTASYLATQELWIPLYTPAEQLSTFEKNSNHNTKEQVVEKIIPDERSFGFDVDKIAKRQISS